MKNVSNQRFVFVVLSQWYIHTYTFRSRLFYLQIAQSFVNETVNIIDMFVKDVKYKVREPLSLQSYSQIRVCIVA